MKPNSTIKEWRVVCYQCGVERRLLTTDSCPKGLWLSYMKQRDQHRFGQKLITIPAFDARRKDFISKKEKPWLAQVLKDAKKAKADWPKWAL